MGPVVLATQAFGNFKFSPGATTVDLIAASTNALNGALLARAPTTTRASPWSGSYLWRCSVDSRAA